MRRALQWYGSRTVPGHFLKNLQPPLCKNLMLLHVLQHFLILHFLAWQASSSSSLLFGWTLELSWRFGASEFWLWDLTQFLPCFSFPFLCHIKAGLGWNKNDALERYFFLNGNLFGWCQIFFSNFGTEETSNLVILVSTSWESVEKTRNFPVLLLNVSWVLDQTSKVDDERIGNNGDSSTSSKSGSKLSGSPSRNSKFGWQTFP